MRFLELDLIAFGHFTSSRIPLQPGPGTVHFFLGRNEAGKSTTLRAVRALLYGFPERSRDTFVHPKPLVGGRLLLENGSEFAFIRRKGRKNTVLDLDQQPVDALPLSQALQGIGENQFVHGYGLDHGSLRAGGKALLEGRGHLGETLYNARLGGRTIHRLLSALEEEASSLFRPKGKQYPLNRAIHDYRAAQREVRAGIVRREAYRAQLDALRDARSELTDTQSRVRAVNAELDSKKRALGLLPLVSRYRDLDEQRAQLGAVPTFASGTEARREEAEREVLRGRDLAGDQQIEIQRLEHKLQGLGPPSALGDLPEGTLQEIEARKVSAVHAKAELPGKVAERDALQLELREKRLAIGQGDQLKQDGWRVPPQTVARIHSLSRDRAALMERIAQSQERASSNAARLSSVREKLQALGDAPELDRLIALVEESDRLLSAPLDAAALSQQLARLRQRTAQLASSLRPSLPIEVKWDSPSSWLAISSIPIPDEPSMDQIAQSREARFLELDAAQERFREHQGRLQELKEKRAAIESAGAVPDVNALRRARRTRDRLWAAIRRSVDEPAQQDAAAAQEQLNLSKPELASFEEALRTADNIADELWMDAERVAVAAELDNMVMREQAQRPALAAAVSEAEQQKAAALDDWNRLWSDTGVLPSGPSEMRAWLRVFAELRQTVEELAGVHQGLDALESQTEKTRREIQAELVRLGAISSGGEESLSVLTGLAKRFLEQEEARLEQRRSLRAQEDSLSAEAPILAQELDRSRNDLLQWKNNWAKTVAPLGLDDDSLPEEANVVLEGSLELVRRSEQLRELERSIQQLEEAGTCLNRLLEPHRGLLSNASKQERSSIEVAEQLVAEARRAKQDAVLRREVTEELESRREQLEAVKSALHRGEQKLAGLMKEAGVDSLDRLRTVHANAHKAAAIDVEMQALESQMEALADGRSISELIERVRNLKSATLRVEQAELEAELQELQGNSEMLQQRVGRLEAGLENQRGRADAATAALEAEVALASIKEHAGRVVMLRLAASMMRRHIERYRDQHQAPLMARANELFPRLTLGAFQGLKIGFSERDEAVLRCIRANDEEVGVEQLSDGTQDQLYLAMRLASLERQARLSSPFPLILDDVLIHFDDERARAALQVLGLFAETSQVLFFSHQSRLLELARQAIPKDRLDVHDLDAIRSREAVLRTTQL